MRDVALLIFSRFRLIFELLRYECAMSGTCVNFSFNDPTLLDRHVPTNRTLSLPADRQQIKTVGKGLVRNQIPSDPYLQLRRNCRLGIDLEEEYVSIKLDRRGVDPSNSRGFAFDLDSPQNIESKRSIGDISRLGSTFGSICCCCSDPFMFGYAC